MKWWYYAKDGKKYAPVDDEGFQELIRSGEITHEDQVWRPGWKTWLAAGDVEGLFEPPPLQIVPAGDQASSQSQSVVVPSHEDQGQDANEEPQVAEDQVAELPTKWLTFYSCVRLPLSAILAFGSSPNYIGAICAALYVVVSWGLIQRRIWGWWINWVLVIFDAALITINASAKQAGTPDFKIMFSICLSLALLLWVLPNFIYFQKRKHLFS